MAIDTADGLAVSSGSNRGEAAYLGDSSWDPVKYTENLVHMARQDKALKDKRIADNAALLTDETKAQWASDDLNYIQPKLQALRDKTIKLFRETNGDLTPLQKAENQNERNRLKSYVTISNKLHENYIDKVKALDQDKGKNYNLDASRELLQIWNNPTAVPQLKEEINTQFGGDINAWRVANEGKFQLIPSYDEDSYFAEKTKDEKPSAYQRRDAKGNIVYETLPTGEKAFYEGKKLTQDQVNSVTNRIWNGTEYKDVKTKEKAAENINNLFSVGENGSVSFNAQLPEASKKVAQKIISNSGNLTGLSTEEIKNRLAKGYIATQVETRNGEGESLKQIGFAPQRSGDSNKKETVTIASHYNNIANSIQDNPNQSPEQIATQFGGKAKVNPTTGLFTIEVPIPPTTSPFVSVPAKAMLTLQNGKYRPAQGIAGQVAGTVAGNEIMWKKDGVSVTPNTPGAKAYGQVYFNPVQVDVNNDDELSKALALFNNANPNTSVTKEVYKKMLEEGDKAGTNFKVEYDLNDPVARTYYDKILGGTTISQTAFNKESKAKATTQKTNTPATNKKVLSTSTIKSKVGTKGFEGYTEKELIDYYRSQGYQIQ